MGRLVSGFFLLGLVYSILLVGSCYAASQSGSQPPSMGTSLQRFLQNWDGDKETRYIASFRDLNGDGIPEALVYLLGGGWCGSGGCTTLVLGQSGNSWKIVTKVTVTRLPIRVLSNASNGWHKIGVWVQGGGILKGYEAELSFDGKAYPSNPTVQPAKRLAEKAEGEAVIDLVKGAIPLFNE